MLLDGLIRFYETLSPDSVERIGEFYADDAYFKDPFNEVRGCGAIRHIFRHMFEQLAEPRFVVTERIVDAGGAMLLWEFHYRIGRRGGARILRGVSHLRFAADGRVAYHRDYWDTAEELYMKVPGLGILMRGLRRLLAA